MPFTQVMPKFKAGELRSGGPSGPPVKDRKQAVAIMLSEKRKAEGDKTEYQASSAQPKPKPKSKGFASIKKDGKS